jgi:hypothetical protein
MSPVVRPLPCLILAPSLLQQLPVAPVGLPGDPMLLLLVVVVVVVILLPNLLENPKPLACLSLLLHPSRLPRSSQMPSLLRSWLPTVVPAQLEPVQVCLVVDFRPGLRLPVPIPGKRFLPVTRVMIVLPVVMCCQRNAGNHPWSCPPATPPANCPTHLAVAPWLEEPHEELYSWLYEYAEQGRWFCQVGRLCRNQSTPGAETGDWESLPLPENESTLAARLDAAADVAGVVVVSCVPRKL